MKSKMAAGQAVEMGYRNVYWYKEGLAGWKAAHQYIESSDFSYMNRNLPNATAPKDLQAKLAAGEDLVLVDIRDEKSKHKMGRIDGPTIDCELYHFDVCYERLPKKKMLVLYDIGAKQAPSAVRFLMDKRFYFVKLSWLDGGMTAWTEQGLPVQEY